MSDSGVYNGLGRSSWRTFLDQKKASGPRRFESGVRRLRRMSERSTTNLQVAGIHGP